MFAPPSIKSAPSPPSAPTHYPSPFSSFHQLKPSYMYSMYRRSLTQPTLMINGGIFSKEVITLPRKRRLGVTEEVAKQTVGPEPNFRHDPSGVHGSASRVQTFTGHTTHTPHDDPPALKFERLLVDL